MPSTEPAPLPAAASGAAADAADAPRVLGDALALCGDLAEADKGVAWRLDVPGRQLDANVVRLPPGERIELHSEPDLDVLLMVTAGTGTVRTEDGPLALHAGAVAWLPRGSTRALAAGDEGLAYLTVHRRRPGLQIRRLHAAPTDPPHIPATAPGTTSPADTTSAEPGDEAAA